MRLIDVIKSVEKLERLLKVTTPQDKGARASEIDVLAEKYGILHYMHTIMHGQLMKGSYNYSKTRVK